MNLKEVIEKQYNTMYRFAKDNDLSPQKVSYWCKTDWQRLTYTTREKICKLLDVEVC